MKKIYFVRHGESVANRQGYLGGKDAELSDTGVHQANYVSQRFQNLDITRLFASDFVRAQQTAKPISEVTGLPIIIDQVFGEYLEPSCFLGRAEDDLEVMAYRKERNQKVELDPGWLHSDEESVGHFIVRIKTAKELLEAEKVSNIAVVSHAFFIQSFIATILLRSTVPTQSWLSTVLTLKHSNTGISLLTFDEGVWRVVMFNDHAHFADE